MRHCVHSVLLVLLLVAGSLQTAEANLDPCADLVGGRESVWSAINGFFRISQPTLIAGGIGRDEFWVAKQPGVFVNVSCAGQNIEDQEMFPIGTVVRPLSLVELSGYPAHRGQPVLVLTEFGHRKVVPQSAFTRIAENLTYLFADGREPIRICKTAAGCISNDAAVCGDGCTQELSAFWGYAAVGSDAPDFRRAVEAYTRLLPDDPRLSPEEVARAAGDVCTPFNVQSFSTGGARHYPDSPDPSHLTFCAAPMTPTQLPGLATVKMVDKDYAQARFKGLLFGSFHRRFGAPLPETITFRAFQEKPCGVEIEEAINAGFEASGGFDIRALASAQASISSEWTRTMTVAADEHLLVQTYFMETPVVTPPDEDRPLKAFRVISKAACEGSSIARPISVEIQFEGQGSRMTSATFDAKRQGDLVQRLISDGGMPGLKPSEDLNFIRNGWFWKIVDHVPYYIWRDHFRRVLTEDMPDFEIMLRGFSDSGEKELIRDFFVHLALSAAFYHDDPCTKRSVICE